MTSRIELMPGINYGLGGGGPYKIQVVEDGELVRDVKFELGYGHRGVQASIQKVSFVAGNAIADKVDYLAAPACNLAYCLAVERLSHIEVPARAKYVRVLLTELNRISSHLFFMAQVAHEVGLQTAFHFALRERERYLEIFEMYCGSRIPFGSICIGGVSAEVTEGFLYRIENALKETDLFGREFNGLMMQNALLLHRLSGLATISPEAIQSAGITGPNARASGVQVDVRKDSSYAAYDEISFPEIVTASFKGDMLSRVRCRLLEISQSIEMIRSILNKIPKGNFRIGIGADFLPPKGDTYLEVESPRGAFGVFVRSDGKREPARVHFSTPSYLSLRAVPDILKQIMVEDVYLVLLGLDICMSEVDR